MPTAASPADGFPVRSGDDDEHRGGVRWRVRADTIDCPLGDGIAILDMRSNTYFSLNASGALIWDEARTAKTARQLAAALDDRFACPADAAADVGALLEALLDAGLIDRIGPGDG